MLKLLIEINEIRGKAVHILETREYEEEYWKERGETKEEAAGVIKELLYESILDCYQLYHSDEVIISMVV